MRTGGSDNRIKPTQKSTYPLRKIQRKAEYKSYINPTRVQASSLCQKPVLDDSIKPPISFTQITSNYCITVGALLNGELNPNQLNLIENSGKVLTSLIKKLDELKEEKIWIARLQELKAKLERGVEPLQDSQKENPLVTALEGLLKHDAKNLVTELLFFPRSYPKAKTEEARGQRLSKAKEAIQNLQATLNNYNNSITAIKQSNNSSFGAIQEIPSLEELKEYFPKGISTQETPENKIDLKPEDFPVKLDPYLLKTILQNLVDNARESGSQGYEIDFSIKKEGDFLKVEIKNPMSDEVVKYFINNRIGAKLEKGEQVTSKNNPTNTNGTFLKTVKTLLPNYGGSIKFDYPKTPEDPHTFTVKLSYPLEKTSEI